MKFYLSLLSLPFVYSAIVYLSVATWSASSKSNIYISVAEGQRITNRVVNTNKQYKDPLHLQKITAVKGSHIATGSQPDIDNFNKNFTYGEHNKRKLQAFQNRTNSYWLNPSFQFGPGSVNDFGGDPNAEAMLQPYIF